MKRRVATRTVFAVMTASTIGFGVGGCAVDSVGPGGGGADGGGNSSPDAGPADCSGVSGTPTVEVGGGTAVAGFVPLTDGTEMVGSIGPQGLFMLTPSFRSTGLYGGQSGRDMNHPHDPEVSFEILKDGSNVGGSIPARLGLTPTNDGAELLVIFTPFSEVAGETYVNDTVTLKVTVNDACSGSASDELTITVTK